MRLRHIHPHPLLKGYIEKLWVFESSGRVSNEDMKLIVPNGLIKLVIPFKNGLSGKMEGWYHLSKENSITVIGITDKPSIVEAENDAPAGTIGLEFSPKGAYRFFHLKQAEIRNQIHPLVDVLGKTAKELEERISSTPDIEEKIRILQQYLLQLFLKQDNDPIFDFCIQKLKQSQGRITIKELEKQTGYSSRWLNMKFIEKVGISPKNLSSIIRFQQYFQTIVNNSEMAFFQKEFYNYFYDQSHFIKEFRRFTGITPTRFQHSTNDFGKIFYRD
jgi:AraC-like DNA-binding protein